MHHSIRLMRRVLVDQVCGVPADAVEVGEHHLVGGESACAEMVVQADAAVLLGDELEGYFYGVYDL